MYSDALKGRQLTSVTGDNDSLKCKSQASEHIVLHLAKMNRPSEREGGQCLREVIMQGEERRSKKLACPICWEHIISMEFLTESRFNVWT